MIPTTKQQREAKDWLMRGWRINREIDALEDTRASMWDLVTSTTADLNAAVVQSTKNPHKFDRYAELSDLIDARIADLISISVEITTTVQSIKDGRLRAIILKRYTQFKRFEEIALDMGYDWRHIMRLHTDALDAVYKLIK